MDTGITIKGAEPPKEHVEAVSSAIVDVLAAGLKSGMEQATVCKALDILGKLTTVENISIAHCSIVSNDRNVILEENE